MDMPDAAQEPSNGALWLGVLLTVLALVGNVLPLVTLLPVAFTWLVAAISALGAIFLVLGLVRTFRRPQPHRGKMWGSVVAVLSLLLCVGSAMFILFARHLPRSAGAPQVGQRVPEFTLTDSTGQNVSLSQLLAGAPGATPPKAVLLVFYRGYW
jgi:hypothetical protein